MIIFRRVRCAADWLFSRPSHGPRGLSEQLDEIIDHPLLTRLARDFFTLEPFGFEATAQFIVVLGAIESATLSYQLNAKVSVWELADKAAIVPITSAFLYPIPSDHFGRIDLFNEVRVDIGRFPVGKAQLIPGFPHDLAGDQQPGVSARGSQSSTGGCWLLAQVRVVEDDGYGLDRLNAAVRGRWCGGGGAGRCRGGYGSRRAKRLRARSVKNPFGKLVK